MHEEEAEQEKVCELALTIFSKTTLPAASVFVCGDLGMQVPLVYCLPLASCSLCS